jgi:hypothetical protein
MRVRLSTSTRRSKLLCWPPIQEISFVPDRLTSLRSLAIYSRDWRGQAVSTRHLVPLAVGLVTPSHVAGVFSSKPKCVSPAAYGYTVERDNMYSRYHAFGTGSSMCRSASSGVPQGVAKIVVRTKLYLGSVIHRDSVQVTLLRDVPGPVSHNAAR